VELNDKTVLANADQTITCAVTGMSAETTVKWFDPNNQEISDTDTTNYLLNEGNFIDGNKEYFLTIKKVVMKTLAGTSIWKCQLKSALYPDHSPEALRQMTLTSLTIGMISLIEVVDYFFSLNYGISETLN
jgi:hypothetical protein